MATVALYGKSPEARKFLNYAAGKTKTVFDPPATVEHDNYYGGYRHRPTLMTQSYERQVAYASTFIRTLHEAAIPGLDLYSRTRLD